MLNKVETTIYWISTTYWALFSTKSFIDIQTFNSQALQRGSQNIKSFWKNSKASKVMHFLDVTPFSGKKSLITWLKFIPLVTNKTRMNTHVSGFPYPHSLHYSSSLMARMIPSLLFNLNPLLQSSSPATILVWGNCVVHSPFSEN